MQAWKAFTIDSQTGGKTSYFAAGDLAVTYKEGETAHARPELLQHSLGLFCFDDKDKAIEHCGFVNVEIWEVEAEGILTSADITHSWSTWSLSAAVNDLKRGGGETIKEEFVKEAGWIMAKSVKLVKKVWPE